MFADAQGPLPGVNEVMVDPATEAGTQCPTLPKEELAEQRLGRSNVPKSVRPFAQNGLPIRLDTVGTPVRRVLGRQPERPRATVTGRLRLKRHPSYVTRSRGRMSPTPGPPSARRPSDAPSPVTH